MPDTRRFNYKGYAITIRCCESTQADSDRAIQFSASFSATPRAAGVDLWQEFPSGVFADQATATANALMVAMRSIDQVLSTVTERA